MSAQLQMDLPTPLEPSQVRRYVDDGFLVVPGLVSPAELEELKQDALFIARGGYPADKLVPLPSGLSDREALARILCIHQPHALSPVMKKYALHRMICGILSQITAAHLPFWDGSVKCMQTMLFVKPPGFQGQAWHQDEIFIPTRDRSLVGAWIAIDDATAENGCLHVIPGSHRPGYLFPQRPHTRLDEWDYSEESFGFDASTSVTVPVAAGTVVFFNGYLLHSSFRNRSDVYRRALVSHYMNSYSLLPWHPTAAGVPIATDDVRTVIPVAGNDPYSWKGTVPHTEIYVRQCQAIGSP